MEETQLGFNFSEAERRDHLMKLMEHNAHVAKGLSSLTAFTIGLEERTNENSHRIKSLEEGHVKTQQHIKEADRTKGFRSVAAFSKLVDQYWGEKDRQDIGKELSKLCRRYGYRRGESPDERWNRVYTYPPFIQKEWCLRNHVPVPEELQDVYE